MLFRVEVRVPGERLFQFFAPTLGQAKAELAKILVPEKGKPKPKGTVWSIFERIETLKGTGVVGDQTE